MRRLNLEALEDRQVPSTVYVSNFLTPNSIWEDPGSWLVNGQTATQYPGESTSAIVEIGNQGNWPPVLDGRISIDQLVLDSGCKTLTIAAGSVLWLENVQSTDWSGSNLDIEGTLQVDGGTLTDTTTELDGAGKLLSGTGASGNLTFNNSNQVQIFCTVEAQANTLTLSGTGSLKMSQNPSGTVGNFVIDAGATMNVTVDNPAGITCWASQPNQVIDLKGSLNKTGTIAPSPNNYWASYQPLFLDGNSATVNIPGGDGLYFYNSTGDSSSGNRGMSVYDNASGSITLNSGSTLYAYNGIQMDGGQINCQAAAGSILNNWFLSCPSGPVIQNGNSLNLGGINDGGQGIGYETGNLWVNIGGTYHYTWYVGNIQIGLGRAFGQDYWGAMWLNANLEVAAPAISARQSLTMAGLSQVLGYGTLPSRFAIFQLTGGAVIQDDYTGGYPRWDPRYGIPANWLPSPLNIPNLLWTVGGCVGGTQWILGHN